MITKKAAHSFKTSALRCTKELSFRSSTRYISHRHPLSIPTPTVNHPLYHIPIRHHYDAYQSSQSYVASLDVSPKQQDMIMLEHQYGAHNYQPIPVVLSRGEGVYVWDIDNRRYLDFLSAYSAVNQGHCHPKILEALTKQAARLTLTSRAFYNDQLGAFCHFMTQTLGYDRMLPMNVRPYI